MLVEHHDFFRTALHSTPPLGGPCRNIALPFGVLIKTRTVWLLEGEQSLRICVTVSTEYRRVADRQTDGRTDIMRRHNPRYALHSIAQ